MMDDDSATPPEDFRSASKSGQYADLADDALIRAIARTDERALRELYERHARWLALRLRRTMPIDAVEDVLQETFLAVWRGAGRFQGSGEVGGWIWGIARRQAAMWARRHGRPDLSLENVPELRSRSSGDPAQIAVARADLGQAFATLGARGSREHDLARHVFVDHRPLAEIAEELGIPTGTVKSRVFALRRRLRESLGKEHQQ